MAESFSKEALKRGFVGEIYERYIYNAVSAHPFVPFARVRKQAHVIQLIRHVDDTGRRSRSVSIRAKNSPCTFIQRVCYDSARFPHVCINLRRMAIIYRSTTISTSIFQLLSVLCVFALINNPNFRSFKILIKALVQQSFINFLPKRKLILQLEK